jgi:hypothetical protein
MRDLAVGWPNPWLTADLRSLPKAPERSRSRGEAHCRLRCRWRKLTSPRMSPGNRRRFLSIAIALIGAPGVTSGQWLHYPTPDVPRTPGQPNLTAPPPRLPDGRADFSGIWQSAVKIPCTPEFSRFVECGLEIGGSRSALNLGAGVPGGLPCRPWAAALVKQRTEDNNKDDPHARCLPDNPPRPYGLPHMTKAVHTPRLLVLLNEVNAMYRQIFIDGRPLPVDPNPSWNGYSSAAWDGARSWSARTASGTGCGSTWPEVR